jgi:Ca2+-binding RTX toxin-like protein
MRTCGLLATIVSLAAPAWANAATATLESGTALEVEAAGGETNRLSVTEDGGGFTVMDATAPLNAGSGCTAVSSAMVRCATTTTPRSVFIDAGDGSDRVTLRSLDISTASVARGGAGGDRIFGGGGDDILHGDGGVDSLVGGSGINTLDGGLGDDFLYGGSGRDRISFATRKRSVTVDLAKGKAGQRGEKDVLDEVEEAIGGQGSDELRGSSAANTLLGGPGAGRDRVDGRGGNDSLVGKRVIGGRGSDRIDGRRLDCGSGGDTVYRDRYRPPGPFPRSCERVLAKFVVLRARPVKSSRSEAVFGLRCFRAKHCSGTLEVRDSRGRLGRQDFSLKHGRVRIPFNRPPEGSVVRLRIRDGDGRRRSSFRTRLR